MQGCNGNAPADFAKAIYGDNDFLARLDLLGIALAIPGKDWVMDEAILSLVGIENGKLALS